MHVCVPCVHRSLQRLEKHQIHTPTPPPGTGVTNGCGVPDGFWKRNLSPLQEPQAGSSEWLSHLSSPRKEFLKENVLPSEYRLQQICFLFLKELEQFFHLSFLSQVPIHRKITQKLLPAQSVCAGYESHNPTCTSQSVPMLLELLRSEPVAWQS